MSAGLRSSGSKAVMTAVVGTVAVALTGTIYLPFVADRDKMRGLHEEQDAPTSAMLAQEMRKLQKEGLLKGDDDDEQKSDRKTSEEKKKLAPGSMWSKFSK